MLQQLAVCTHVCGGKSFLATCAAIHAHTRRGIVWVNSLTCVDLRPNSRLPGVDSSPVSNKHIVTFDIVYDGCLQMQTRPRVATPFRLRAQQGPPHKEAVPHSPAVCPTLCRCSLPNRALDRTQRNAVHIIKQFCPLRISRPAFISSQRFLPIFGLVARIRMMSWRARRTPHRANQRTCMQGQMDLTACANG